MIFEKRPAAVALLSLLVAGCTAQSSVYCANIARHHGPIFMPVYPPKQNIAPGSLIELDLRKGWSTTARDCPSFSTRHEGEVITTATARVYLPSFSLQTDANGFISFGDIAQPATTEFIRHEAQMRREVQVAYDDVVTQGTPRRLSSVLNTVDGVERLAETAYPLAEYRNRVGLTDSSPTSLWFLWVEEVYLAKTVLILVAAQSGSATEANFGNVLQQVNAGLTFPWSKTDRLGTAERLHTYDPPVAIGLRGILLEVDNQDGKIVRKQTFPGRL